MGLLYMDTPLLADYQRLMYIKLCEDTGCTLKDLPSVIDERERERHRQTGNSVVSAWLDIS